MRIKLLLSLASAGVVLVCTAHGSPFAASVVSYNPGVGYAAGYTNTNVVVGQPSTGTAKHPLNVTPFDPPSSTNQILALGAGGSLTVSFDPPIVSGVPGNPYGLDFLIFGDSFFVETNGGVATGAVSTDVHQATVSVSSDGVTFYQLNPALAPELNYLYPTDGSGNFQIPVNPALTNFTNLTLAQIRALYNGSAGGAGYELAWAQDANSNSVPLFQISYIRVDVQSGEVLIGGFAAVTNTNQIVAETFSRNPALDGWKIFGDTNLFTWDAANQDLQVTWDSTQSNSYFYHPLGAILTSNDAFTVSFDLLLNDANINGDGTNSLQIGIGFLNLAEAENTNFLIGTGENSTNVAEFEFYSAAGDYYEGYLPSLVATLIDTNGNSNFASDDIPWNFGTFYHVTISHAAGTSVLTGQILANGLLYSSLPGTYNGGAGDFRLDTISISSYSDMGTAEIGFPCSVTAHGIVKNILVTGPPPPVTYLTGSLTNGIWRVQFGSRTNWNYTLEKSSDLQRWLPLAPTVAGTGGQMTLQDTNAPGQSQYYRVSANPE
jgi:hypothetical protein